MAAGPLEIRVSLRRIMLGTKVPFVNAGSLAFPSRPPILTPNLLPFVRLNLPLYRLFSWNTVLPSGLIHNARVSVTKRKVPPNSLE